MILFLKCFILSCLPSIDQNKGLQFADKFDFELFNRPPKPRAWNIKSPVSTILAHSQVLGTLDKVATNDTILQLAFPQSNVTHLPPEQC